MSENWRKDINEYTVMCSPGRGRDKPGQLVFRPNSMRRVSATKELNRLTAEIRELKTSVKHLQLELNRGRR
jgi:hypothetical protein